MAINLNEMTPSNNIYTDRESYEMRVKRIVTIVYVLIYNLTYFL